MCKGANLVLFCSRDKPASDLRARERPHVGRDDGEHDWSVLRAGHESHLPLQHQGQRGRRHRREQARLKIILQISLSKVGLIAVDLGWVELDLGCSGTQLGKLVSYSTCYPSTH